MTVAPRRAPDLRLIAIVAAAALGLVETARAAPTPVPHLLSGTDIQFEPLDWTAVDGWTLDDTAAAFATFQQSCKPLIAAAKAKRPPRRETDRRVFRHALAAVCVEAAKLDAPDSATARKFFEKNFRPVQIGALGEENGFYTGYYEPIVEGSRFPSDEYDVPIYARPSNLVPAHRRSARGEFPNRGRVGRRFGRRHIVPYYDRGEIEDGVLAGRGLEICWLKDPIDAFFLQIQGSARVKLDTGKTLRLNYAAHNGLPYTPVGRILIDRGLIPKAEMSMDRIREWMNNNPTEADQLRRQNRSYVFMRETGLADDDEAVGAQGVPLTPRRSIAVDRRLHVYGTPVFVSADLPIDSEAPVTPFRQLMIAQDTGSAIVGPARADIYFGAGKEAGEIAGRLKQSGKFVMLVPRALDPSLAGAKMPVPRRRPPEPEIKVSIAETSAEAVDTVVVPLPPPPVAKSRLVPLPKPRPPMVLDGRP
jgi:membrane-bound lytic murein transglycosylase A